MNKKIFLLVFLFLIPCVFAYDLEVSVIIEDDFVYGTTNQYKFLILNNETASETINFTFYHNITDLNGNLLKSFTGNYNLKRQKTITYQWTPRFQVEENITPIIICGKIISSTANDFNYLNDFSCKQLNVIDGYEEFETIQRAEISINKIYSKKDYLEFGEIFLVKLKIKRNNISKYAVYAYVESKDNKKVSEETLFYVPSGDHTFTFKIPIALKPDCFNKYPNGTYYLVVEGLNEKEKQRIDILGNLQERCEIKYSNITEIIYINNTEEILANYSTEQVFNSKSVNSLDFAKYLFIFALLLVAISSVFFKK